MATAIGRQWLIFELSGQAYGVDVRHVREIVSLRDMHIHAMPQASSFIEGVVLLARRADRRPGRAFPAGHELAAPGDA